MEYEVLAPGEIRDKHPLVVLDNLGGESPFGAPARRRY